MQTDGRGGIEPKPPLGKVPDLESPSIDSQPVGHNSSGERLALKIFTS